MLGQAGGFFGMREMCTSEIVEILSKEKPDPNGSGRL